MSDDARYLALAWALATRGAATARPNPPVGCVLVRDGEVVGRGWHARAGEAHAEVVALRDAGDAAAGATAYVTLEPCDHTGRTGPCSVALLDAGVTRAVVARRDPVDAHAGGLHRLERAGVTVEVHDLGGWEDALVHRWLRRLEVGRPWLTLKLAVDARGRTKPSDGRWITGPVARAAVHAQRARVDAVLVGVGTVLVDDPRLDVRDAPLDGPQPRPVVFDSRGRTPLDSTVVRRGAIVVTTEQVALAQRDALTEAGAELLMVEADAGRVDPVAALRALGERGISEVYAEPGSGLSASLVSAGVVDELVIHRGGGAAQGWPRAWHLGTWHVVRSRRLGPDLETVARPG